MDRSRSSPGSHDGFKDRMKALIRSKMKEEVAQVIKERPKKPVAKNMIEALRKIAKSLNLPKTS